VAGSDPQKLPEEIERERWLGIRRQEKRLVAFAALVLFCGTIYMAALNFIAIGISPSNIPFKLEIDHNLPIPATVNPKLFISWRGDKDLVRPVLLLDKREEIPVDSAEGIRVSMDTRHQLYVNIPRRCGAGTHQGKLIVFQTEIADGSLPGHSVPVSVEVSGSLWRNWFILRDWLLFSFLLLIIMYLFCMAIFPRPSGNIVFEDPFGTHLVRRPKVPMKVRTSAWFMPWRRSSIPFKAIWKAAGVRVPLRTEGEISFLFSNIPPFLLQFHRAGASVIRLEEGQLQAQPLDIDAGVEVGSSEHMYGERRYAYRLPNNPAIIVFYFER